MTFWTFTRTTALALLVVVTAIASSASTARAQSLFGTVSDFLVGDFYSIDPATGAATRIGPTGYVQISSLAFHPTTRALYAVGFRVDPDDIVDVLLTIDPATGVAAEIGPTNIGPATVGMCPVDASDRTADIAFRSDGTLFGFTPLCNAVGTIDLSTGAFTALPTVNPRPSRGNGIAFSSTDVLFHANQSNLSTVNQTTGALTSVVALTFPARCDGTARMAALDFQPGTGTLFGILTCNNGTSRPATLATIDTSTGVITEIGPSVEHLDGLAFQPGVTALSPAKLWIGLKSGNPTDVRLDVKAEVFVNSTSGAVVGSGQVDDIGSGGPGFPNALLNTVDLALSDGTVSLAPDDQLLFRVSVRTTCDDGPAAGKAKPGHPSGTVRLWYDGAPIDSGPRRNAGSRFDATVGGTTADYYLRAGFALSTTPGSARTSIDTFVDSSVPCPGRPFTPLGTWSITP
jgi:hypothetical protein